jgi:tRNA 2-thiouridine synthesizing protein A
VAQPLPLRELAQGSWELDCRGMLCPVPVIKAGRALRRVAVGDELLILADDPGAAADLEDWAAANRQQWLGAQIEGDDSASRVRRIR